MASNVPDLVARYVAGAMAIEELEHELPDGWELDGASGDDREEALQIHGYVAEYFAGAIDAEGLRSRLAPFAAWRVERSYTASPLQFVPRSGAKQERAYGAGTSRLVGSA